MSNFLFLHNPYKEFNLNEIKNKINLSDTYNVETFLEEKNIYAVSFHNNAPLKGNRIFNNDNWTILFAGDLIDYDSIPYHKFIDYIENKTFEKFKDFDGTFSIFLYNKKNNLSFLISDRRSQHSVYYFIKNKNIIFATELSFFVKLLDNPGFNKYWLYDYLFFNFPIGSTTFLKDVNKMPPASYMIYDHNASSSNVKAYSDIFKPKEKLLEGIQAFDYAAEVFKTRVPKYFAGSNNIACALTSGWDGRTNIALAPDLEKVTAYSYGTPGCDDLTASKEVTEKLKIKFKEIHFDREFSENLPRLLLETVYLSSGEQGILRATLHDVYKILASQPHYFNLVISGINYDGLFRGHMGIPSIFSSDLADIMRTGKVNINTNYWSRIISSPMFPDFSEEVTNKLNYLKNSLGKLNSSACHTLYFLYHSSTRYFGGELKLASNFTTVRVPAWDNKIIDLAFSIKEGSLSYSELAGHKRGSRDEMEVQAFIFSKLSPEIFKIPIGNTKPKVVLSGEVPFQLYKSYSRIKRKLRNTVQRKQKAYLEDWNYWLNKVHPFFIDKLIFSKESLIKEFIDNEYLENLKTTREIQMIGKLTTAEIILRLLRNKWERFW